ncbi:MAG TPA: hypothetical protein VFB60_16195 [Ktedonobacteraceae bacterium]|nr:hypothetical protein [Ktedonobacteraceae bacterium]
MAGTATGQAQGIAPTQTSQRWARSSQAGRASARHCPYPSDPAMIHHRGHRHRAEGVLGQRQGVWLGAIPRGCPARHRGAGRSTGRDDA